MVDTDDVAAALRELAQRYGQRLGSAARVDQVYGQGVRVRLRPTRPGAVEVGWSDSGQGPEIAIGGYGWRRVAGRPLDAGSIRAICDCVVAGQGGQRTAPGRVLIVLTPPGGPPIRLVARTGWAGAVPLPGWTRYARRTPYAAYT